MSVLSAIKHSDELVTNNELAFKNFVSVNKLNATFQKKWTYLVSNKVRFSAPVHGVIHLHRYKDASQHTILERLVHAGQCGILMVDNFDATEPYWQSFKRLCEQNDVVLVSLSEFSASQNISVGPW